MLLTGKDLFKFSAQESNLAFSVGNGTKVKIPSEIKLPLALTFCLFLTYPELHFKTFFRSSDSNYFFNEGERFHEYCDYDKLLICTMAEITQFCPKIIKVLSHKRLRHVYCLYE